MLRSIFDYVVVDTPAQFSEHVLIAMDSSDHHAVPPTTPDVPALKNLRVTLDMLDLLSYPRQIRSVVVNRSDSKVGLSLEQVEQVVRCPIAGRVPSKPCRAHLDQQGHADHPGQSGASGQQRHHPVRTAAAAPRGRAGRAGAAAHVQARTAVGVSLADRLAQRQAPAAVQHEQPGPKRHGARHADPFAPVKRRVHQSLLETLGPTLYDAQMNERGAGPRAADAAQVMRATRR